MESGQKNCDEIEILIQTIENEIAALEDSLALEGMDPCHDISDIITYSDMIELAKAKLKELKERNDAI